MEERVDQSARRKLERGRAAYADSKGSMDAVLLRLRRGDGSRIDSACRAAGMGRTAFCRERLAGLLEAVAPRLADIDRAGGLEAVLARALPPTPPPLPDAALEFDALFGAS
jgi:hypothetical protein